MTVELIYRAGASMRARARASPGGVCICDQTGRSRSTVPIFEPNAAIARREPSQNATRKSV